MKNANWKNDIHKAKIQKMNLLKSRAHLVLAIFRIGYYLYWHSYCKL